MANKSNILYRDIVFTLKTSFVKKSYSFNKDKFMEVQ